MRRNPTSRSYSVTGPWRQLILALYASSVLVMVRSVFRMIEFGMGNDSILMSHEGYLLGLDGALMFIVATVLLWYHPSRALSGYKEVLTAAGGTSGDEESGRRTAESLQMLAVDSQGSTGRGVKVDSGKYEAQRGYGYDAAPSPRENRYSAAYGR